jgi:Flp pilus assembly protein TadD/predicted nuclease with TOPRIM domain
MIRTFLLSCLFLLGGIVAPTFAQESAQDLFLKIYLNIQEADKLESAGQKASARERYRISLDRLRDLKEQYPQWEPVIVGFRTKYTEEKVKALEGEVDANPDANIPPIDPDLLAAPETTVDAEPPEAPTPPTDTGAEPMLTEPLDTGDSVIASENLEATQPETGFMDGSTTVDTSAGGEIISNRAPTIMDMEGGTTTLFDPAPIAPTIESSPPPVTVLPEDPAALKSRIRDLESQLASTQDRLESARTEAAQLRTRVQELEQQLSLAREGTADQQMDALMTENAELKDKLAKAESTIAGLQTGSADTSIINLQQKIDNIQGQLELAKQENAALRETNDEYRQKLETLQQELNMAKAETENSKETEMLKDIIRRQLKEQTRREVSKRLAMEELENLAVESERLKTQLDILGSPLVELTSEERALLKQPDADLVINESTGEISADLSPAPDDNVDYSTRPRIPNEFRETAEDAKRLFSQGRFDESAAKYTEILNMYPESLYALSNLAVVRFQQANYPATEELLKTAVKLAPQDAFSHSILGISLYQQGKHDEAVQYLSRAAALDPNDPKTRNYLGIAASQKGWQEAAEQECRKAIELDPQYGDAHFNLAVIYATQKPPARELARRHYNRALELGVPRDAQLEKIIR